MQFLKAVAYPILPDAVNIQWEIDNPNLSGDYKFEIFINSVLARTEYNAYNCQIDRKTIFLAHGTRNDYTIKIVCTPPRIEVLRNIDVFQTDISLYSLFGEKEYNIAREINRKENLLFRTKTGVPVKVYKIKKYGVPCSVCVDAKTGTLTTSQCKTCYGTKYGIYEPVDIWANIVEAQVNKQISDIGVIEDKTAHIRLSNNVLLNKGDIIDDIINRRKWQLSQEPAIVYYRTFPISQQCVAHLVNTKSILNEIKEISFSEKRNNVTVSKIILGNEPDMIISQNQLDAIKYSLEPSKDNPFATINQLGEAALTENQITAIQQANNLSADNPVASMADIPDAPSYPADALTSGQVTELQAGLVEGDGHFATRDDLPEVPPNIVYNSVDFDIISWSPEPAVSMLSDHRGDEESGDFWGSLGVYSRLITGQMLFLKKKMPLDWIPGTPIYPYICWTCQTAGYPEGYNIKHYLEMCFLDNGLTVPNTFKVSTLLRLPQENIVQNKVYISSFGEIATTGASKNLMLHARYKRNDDDAANERLDSNNTGRYLMWFHGIYFTYQRYKYGSEEL